MLSFFGLLAYGSPSLSSEGASANCRGARESYEDEVAWPKLYKKAVASELLGLIAVFWALCEEQISSLKDSM